MNSKVPFDWQANTLASRQFWQKNFREPYWFLLADNSFRLIDYFLGLDNPVVSVEQIAESTKIPFGSTKHHLSYLKKAGVLFSEKSVYHVQKNIRSMANYAIVSDSLVALSNHLQNLNIKDWNISHDPYRSILKKKSEIPANYWERNVAPELQKEIVGRETYRHGYINDLPKNQNEIPANHWERNVGSELHKNNASVLYENFSEEPSKSLGEKRRIRVTNENKNFEFFSCNSDPHLKKEDYLRYISSRCILPSRRERQLEVEKISIGVDGDNSEQEVISKNEQEQTFMPEHGNSLRPRLHISVRNGKARTSREDGHSDAKMGKPIRIMGFAKITPDQSPKRKTLNVANAECEKFVDYWNKLADDGRRIPKCMKMRTGDFTKSFLTALQFFAELRNGKIFGDSRKFFLTRSYLKLHGLDSLEGRHFSDDKVLEMIDHVTKVYDENSTYLPKKFDAILYSTNTNQAKRTGDPQSAFLEILMRNPIELPDLDPDATEISEDEQNFLDYLFVPMWKNLRKVHSEPANSEIIKLLDGLHVLQHLWEVQYKEICENSFLHKSGRVDTSFQWFARSFVDYILDTLSWKDAPLHVIFNPKGRYLGDFLNRIEERF